MRAGALRNRITIQHKTDVRDDWGQPVPAWVEFAKVWADFRFLNGTESIKADMQAGEVRASVRIRKREVSNLMRVVYKDEVYDILAVLPAKEYIDLSVRKAA